MADHKPEDDYNFSPRSFSLFNFWKNPGWRLGTGSDVRGPFWYAAVGISFALGLAVERSDITGGASLSRIATTMLIVSGVTFYFLIRLRQTLFWGAVVSACGAALVFVLQLRLWFINDAWPAWQVDDLAVLAEISDGVGGLPWLAGQSAIGALIAALVLFLAATIAVQRLSNS